MTKKKDQKSESFAQLLDHNDRLDKAVGGAGDAQQERAQWQDYSRSLKPLKQKTKARVAQEPYSLGETFKRMAENREYNQRQGEQEQQQLSQLAPLVHGQAAGLDARNAQRLKRGKFATQARIDLHGMTQKQANAALIDFVLRAHSQGLRHLLVITGKGLNKENSGVLKQQIPNWLNMSPLREKILAFDYAQPRDGGMGALYLLLRKNTESSAL